MGRDTRGAYDGYDDAPEDYDRRSTRGPRSGPGGRTGMTPPRGGPPSDGRRTASSDPSSRRGTSVPPPSGGGLLSRRAAETSGPQRDPRPRSDPRARTGRPYEDERDDGRGAPPRRSGATYGEQPPDATRARSTRRPIGEMARDLSRSMSRQLSSIVSRTGEAIRRTGRAAEAPGTGRYGPPQASARYTALSPELLAQLPGSRYRRSRIRMRARKWRLGRVRANPIIYATSIAVLFVVVLVVLGAGGAGGVYAYTYYQSRRADIQAIADLRYAQSTQILDRNGTLLYTTPKDTGYNYYVPLSQISNKVQLATIDTEDHTFYGNIGIDFQGTLRSALVDLSKGGQAAQGGSTITQQVVKNLVLQDRNKAIQRKLNELILAYGVTQQYDKHQILEMYLNTIDYGDQNQGIEAAARNFFGIQPKTQPDGTVLTANMQLSWAQAALLAGLPNAPSYYLPIQFSCQAAPCPQSQWDNPLSPKYDGRVMGHEWRVYYRAQLVLSNLVQYGDLSRAEYDKALVELKDILENQKIYHWAGIKTGDVVKAIKLAPNFVDYVMEQLTTVYGIDRPENKGLRVYTTLDYNLQQVAEASIKKYITVSDKNPWYPSAGAPLSVSGNAHNGAAVAVDPHTGDILAMVGSVDYGNKDPRIGGYNNLTTANRSLGSSVKPVVYATAFQMGWTPGTMLQDQPICMPAPVKDNKDPISVNCNGWYTPHNYTFDSFSGTAPLRVMLANSLNVPAVETMSFVGSTPATSQAFLAMAARMGITTLSRNNMGPTTALGTQVIPLIELTGAYAVLANYGKRVPERAILRITDAGGNDVCPNCFEVPKPAQVLSPQAAYMITSVLTDNEARAADFGWHNPLYFNDPAFAPNNLNFPAIAAKTGTSSGNTGPPDIVTMGYSPYMALGVWIGNTDGSAMQKNIIGIAGAGYVFHDMMAWAIKNYNWPNTNFPIPANMARGRFNCTSGLAPYKGTTPGECVWKPASGSRSTNIYSGFNGGAGADRRPDEDWYIVGQEPLQS